MVKKSGEGCIWPEEIIPVEENSKLEMNPAGGNNPCGRKQQARDESDRGKVIPVEQKSKIEMNPAGGNNPCGTEKQDRDADQFQFVDELQHGKKISLYHEREVMRKKS